MVDSPVISALRHGREKPWTGRFSQARALRLLHGAINYPLSTINFLLSAPQGSLNSRSLFIMATTPRRIVLKFGSGILANMRGTSLDDRQFRRLCAEIAELTKQGCE